MAFALAAAIEESECRAHCGEHDRSGQNRSRRECVFFRVGSPCAALFAILGVMYRMIFDPRLLADLRRDLEDDE